MESNADFWGQPISTYTDRDAIEDGILVPVNRTDRVTRPAFAFLAEHTPLGAKPPDCWPVEVMNWFKPLRVSQEQALRMIVDYGKDGAQAKLEEMNRDRKALALAKGLIGRDERTARRVYENNEGGGIHSVHVVTGETGEILGLSDIEIPSDPKGNLGWKPAGNPTTKLWLIPNENGGITVMFPEDY